MVRRHAYERIVASLGPVDGHLDRVGKLDCLSVSTFDIVTVTGMVDAALFDREEEPVGVVVEYIQIIENGKGRGYRAMIRLSSQK